MKVGLGDAIMKYHVLVICLMSLVIAGEALAVKWEMPVGRWHVTEESEAAFDVLISEGFNIQLVFTQGYKHTVVFAKYETTMVKFSDYHVEIKPIDIVVREEDGSISKEQSLTLLEFEFREATPLSATMHFGCVEGKEYLQFCLHEGYEEGETPHVVCRDMFDPERSCEAMEPLEGGEINRPISPLSAPGVSFE